MRLPTTYLVRTVMDDRQPDARAVRSRRAKRERRADLRRTARLASRHPATASAATKVQRSATQPDVVIDLREEVVASDREKGLVRT